MSKFHKVHYPDSKSHRQKNKTTIKEIGTGNSQKLLISGIKTTNFKKINQALKQGADLNKSSENYFPLELIPSSPKAHYKILKFLSEHGADINILCGVKHSTLLHRSINDGNNVLTKFLINNVKNINVSDMYGQTALHYAIFNKDVKNTKFLVHKRDDLDPNIADNNGLTPFIWACKLNNFNHLGYLLNCQDIDLNKKDNNGFTGLHWLAYKGLYKTVQLILETASDYIDINATDSEHKVPTALSLSLKRGYSHTAEVLIENKADRGIGAPINLSIVDSEQLNFR